MTEKQTNKERLKDITDSIEQGIQDLRASLETINKTSSELISDIDRHYAEIMKEREPEIEVAKPTINEPVLQSETEETCRW